MPDAITPFPWFDLAMIGALVALNGVFAMSELAIVSPASSGWRRWRAAAGAARGWR
jgi:putative hemolysin